MQQLCRIFKLWHYKCVCKSKQTYTCPAYNPSLHSIT